ncbi:MAG: hypothetical protein WBA77_20425 [Microcoleaceae cyanobacterium]
MTLLNHDIRKHYRRSLQKSRNIPLRLLLVVPFVIQIIAAVGLTGFLSFRNGQRAVNDLANQLQNEVSQRVELHLDPLFW